MTVAHSEEVGAADVEELRANPEPRNILLVFGGFSESSSIRAVAAADKALEVSEAEASNLFDFWVNMCPTGGTGNVHTEEALLVGVANVRRVLSSR